MKTSTLQVRTGDEDVVLDLTDQCAAFVRELGDGLLHVFVPHADLNVDNHERSVRLDFLAG